jgi:2-oxoglutarate dehydrogenase E1 component
MVKVSWSQSWLCHERYVNNEASIDPNLKEMFLTWGPPMSYGEAPSKTNIRKMPFIPSGVTNIEKVVKQ